MKQTSFSKRNILKVKLLVAAGVAATALVMTGFPGGHVAGLDGAPYNAQPITLSPNSATIGWQTRDASDSKVLYGVSTSYGSSKVLGSATRTHEIELSNLKPGTTYHYKVGDVAELAMSVDYSFTTPYDYGVLTSSALAHSPDETELAAMYEKGVRIHSVDLSWDLYEPTNNNFSNTYINAKKAEIATYKTQGYAVVLETGAHYTPSWVTSLEAAAVYRNQYGNSYTPGQPGKNIANGVFSNAVRMAIADYHEQVLADLGTDFYAIRVGGGYYGELHYPDETYSGRTNAYWGYDTNAQTGTGLPSGIGANPVPGWIPNPVRNGTFENGADGSFTLSGTDSVITTDAHRGVRSVRKVNPGAWSNQTTQANIPVVSGVTYRFSAWAKSTNGSAPACIQIKRPNGDELAIQCTGNSAYTQLTNTFTAQDSTVEIALLTYDGANTTLTYDDISIMANGYTYDASNANATSFWNWYRDSLTNYQNWQIDTYRNAGYGGKVFVLYPSYGVRSEAITNQINESIGYDLSRTSSASQGGDMQQATDWGSQIGALPNDDKVIAYTTWIDGTGTNGSVNKGDWAPAKYLAYLANQEGRALYGENTGSNSYADMQRTFQYVSDFGYSGLLWFNETQLSGGIYASMANLGTQMQQYDETAPYDLSLKINNGDGTTKSKAVTLVFDGTDNLTDATNLQMIYSEDNSFAGASYQPFAGMKSLTLSGGYGEKTVYVALKDARGNISNTYQAHISYIEAGGNNGGSSGSNNRTISSGTQRSAGAKKRMVTSQTTAQAELSNDSEESAAVEDSDTYPARQPGQAPYDNQVETEKALEMNRQKSDSFTLVGAGVVAGGVVILSVLVYLFVRRKKI